VRSGWGDSNSRPRRPERRALTWLRYTPGKGVGVGVGVSVSVSVSVSVGVGVGVGNCERMSEGVNVFVFTGFCNMILSLFCYENRPFI
jgi:hypothetical protein